MLDDQQLVSRLLRLKRQIEEKQSRRAELQGELKSLMRQLKEFGADTIERAEEILRSMEKELEMLEEDIIARLTDLESALEKVDDEE